MSNEIVLSLDHLEKKKLLVRTSVPNINGNIQEKLGEILHGMAEHKKFEFEKQCLPLIDAAYIDRKVGVLDKTMHGVFDEYVKDLISQAIRVFLIRPFLAHTSKQTRKISKIKRYSADLLVKN